MAAVVLTPDDLAPFAEISAAKAQAMIEDVLAMAATVAPCILTAEFAHAGAAKAILRRAILRWNDEGTGALTTASVDDASFSFDNRTQSRRLFWPSEIEQLQNLCRESATGGAFSIDQVPAVPADSLASRPDLWFQYVFPVPPSAP